MNVPLASYHSTIAVLGAFNIHHAGLFLASHFTIRLDSYFSIKLHNPVLLIL